MAGDVHVGPGNPLIFRNESGDSWLLRLGTTLQISNDGGNTWTPIGGGSFGADTIVQILNSAAQPKNALELIASLTTPTAGSEMSQWLMEVLINGVQTKLFALGNFVGFPFLFIGDPVNTDGILNPSAHRIQFYINGSNYMELSTAVGGVQLSQPFSLGGVRGRRAATASVAVATTIAIPTATTQAGNIVPLTVGTGTLSAINTAGWVANDEFKLVVPSGVTITHNVSGAGGSAPILIPRGDSGAGTSIVVSATAGLNPRIIPIFYNGTNFIVEG